MSELEGPREETYAGDPPLEIPASILAAMIEQCRTEAPREACGILSGPARPRVVTIHRLRNAMASETRYTADSRDLIAAAIAIREKREEWLAIYHSHPTSAAIPSRIDLSQNGYGPLPQIIISLAAAEPSVRAWRLAESSYHELPWRVIVESEPDGR